MHANRLLTTMIEQNLVYALHKCANVETRMGKKLQRFFYGTHFSDFNLHIMYTTSRQRVCPPTLENANEMCSIFSYTHTHTQPLSVSFNLCKLHSIWREFQHFKFHHQFRKRKRARREEEREKEKERVRRLKIIIIQLHDVDVDVGIECAIYRTILESCSLRSVEQKPRENKSEQQFGCSK